MQSSYPVPGSLKAFVLLGFLGSPSEMRSLNSSNKYLLSTLHVAGTVLGTGDTTENKTDKNPYLHGADILVGEDNK